MRHVFALMVAFIGFIGFTSLLASAQAPTQAQVLSFIDWKTQQIQEAQKAISSQSSAKVKGRQGSSATTTETSQQQRLVPQQSKLNSNGGKVSMTVVNELTIHDYFVLYLVPLNDEKAFAEAVAKLQPQEVLDLLKDYRKSLATTDATVLTDPPANPKQSLNQPAGPGF